MKKFKIAICVLVSACTVCLFSGAAAADGTSSGTAPSMETSSGKAYINAYCICNVLTDNINVSNITDKPIKVTVTLYKQNGTLLVDDGNNTSGIIADCSPNQGYLADYSENGTNSSLTFTLNAHSTGIFCLKSPDSNPTFGYGVIQWTQDNSSVTHAMTANIVEIGSTTKCPLSINSGLPF